MSTYPNKEMHRVLAPLVALVCLMFVGGCQLPNVGPYVDATAQLKLAVASGGMAAEDSLRQLPDGTSKADELHKAWDARNKAMSAMLRYAQSLDAIVAAGNAGAESAGKVADSVKGLAEAVGIAIPGSPEAVAVATDAGKFLYTQVARIRAANDLAKALQEAQPAVEKLTALLRADTKDLDEIVKAADGMFTAAIIADADNNQLNSDLKSIRKAMKDRQDLTDTKVRAELLELSKLRAETEQRLETHQARLAAANGRLKAWRSLVQTSSLALDSWSAAHSELAVAARNKTTIDTRALIESAVELREIIRRVRVL